MTLARIARTMASMASEGFTDPYHTIAAKSSTSIMTAGT